MESTMELWVEKANVLIEALPYIRRFHGKTIVVKYGGSAMVDQELKESVIRDVALLKLIGFKPIVVHGGGKDITRWINKIGLETNFINGLRVTDKPTMEVVEMVLNKINKDLVSLMENVGLKAVGISGKDGTILRVDRKLAGDKDIGFVGEVKSVNTELLDTLLDNDFVPVICPVGFDSCFNSYNVNADDAACAIATAVKASKLAFLTDIEGVYRDPLDKSSLISELSIPEAKAFLKSGNVGGGMLPKLQNCINAIEAGVSRVHILDGRIEHCLLLEFFTNKGIGTAIIGDTEERYYSEGEEGK
ncbi:MAG: acetylglutamate kinase [Lachnospiraceae bacterium]|nr:acetylglutamate kinase [Lachnospiraceae bacterium]